MKWIAEMMVVIAVVSVNSENHQQRIVTHVNQVHRNIIAYLEHFALQI